ncbi:MAG: acyl-CoA dehydrogenase family protein [Parvibaculaceae bacterium]
MNFDIPKAQKKWVDLAASLVPEFRARARQYDDAAAYPAENMNRLKELGFLGIGIPVEYGGHDLGENSSGIVQHLVVEKLSEACSSTGWNMMIHWVNCQVIVQNAHDPIRSKVLGDIARRGALVGSLGSEVNTNALKTARTEAEKLKIGSVLRPTKGGFLVSGTKHFCTLAPEADYVLIWALAPGMTRNDDGLVISVVPKNSQGIKFNPQSWSECTGLRASASWSVELDDVLIPEENTLGQPGDFVQNDPYTFDLGHIAHLIGTAQGVFDFTVNFVKQQDYLQSDQVYMYWLTEMHGGLQAARSSFWYANWLWEQKDFERCLSPTYSALHTARQVAAMVVERAAEICGSRSLFKFFPIDRAARDVRAGALHTRDTQLARLQANAILAGDRVFSKRKYGERLTQRKTWEDLGIQDRLRTA